MGQRLFTRYLVLVPLAVAAHLVAGPPGFARDITTPPHDSIEAERVRIWVPIERQNKAWVTIDITNDSNRVIRRLVDRMMSGGYYNFYWDKLTDDGEFVPEGEYTYHINNAGTHKYGTVTAEYTEWERAVRFYDVTPKATLPIRFELFRDSALVSILVRNRRDLIMDTVVVDSLMHSGRHSLDWSPKRKLPRGNYTAEFRIGDYVRRIEFGYTPAKVKR